jgi:hypothetical protein
MMMTCRFVTLKGWGKTRFPVGKIRYWPLLTWSWCAKQKPLSDSSRSSRMKKLYLNRDHDFLFSQYFETCTFLAFTLSIDRPLKIKKTKPI